MLCVLSIRLIMNVRKTFKITIQVTTRGLQKSLLWLRLRFIHTLKQDVLKDGLLSKVCCHESFIEFFWDEMFCADTQLSVSINFLLHRRRNKCALCILKHKAKIQCIFINIKGGLLRCADLIKIKLFWELRLNLEMKHFVLFGFREIAHFREAYRQVQLDKSFERASLSVKVNSYFDWYAHGRLSKNKRQHRECCLFTKANGIMI